jgi:hypothetical protein
LTDYLLGDKMTVDLKQLADSIKEQISEIHYRFGNGLVISNEVTLEHIKSLGIDPNGSEVLRCPRYHEAEFYKKFAETIIEDCIRCYDERFTKAGAIELINERYNTNF